MSSWLQWLYEACCLSKAQVRSRKIDRQIAKDSVQYRRLVNILLLGTPESGKSTLLNLMRIIHGQDFDSDALNEFRPIIYGNILKGMKVLADARMKLGLEWQDPSNQMFAEKILNFQASQYIDTDMFMGYFDCVKRLWRDKGIQDAYDRRREFQLGKSSEYFLNHLERVGRPEYIPTKQDALHATKRHGIVEHKIIIDGLTFNVIDVGEQRYYSANFKGHKWHRFDCFELVTSILFVVSSVDYDKVLMDGTTNYLVDACDFFDRVVNHRMCANVSIILFLTKTDLLMEKIQYANIKDYFPAFQGDPRKLEDVQNFILQMFDSKRRERPKALFHHFTTATDTENIKFVFDAVKDTIEDNINFILSHS